MPEWSRRLFDKAHQAAENRRYRIATLGKHNTDDSIDYAVVGRVDYLWITFPNGVVDIARNEFGVAQIEDMQVKVVSDHGDWCILGRSTKGNLSVPTETPASGVLAHTIEEHSDAAIVAAATGDLLEYSAGHWINAATIPVAQAATIHAATSKTPPVDADELGLVDSAASNVLKKLTWANLKATIKTYYDSVATTLTNKTLDSTNISTLTAKTTPIDADSAVIVDSAASNVFKRVTYTNVKAFLKTYFDTLYDLTGTAITALATKTTPVDADDIVITDSAASNVPKRVTGTNYKAYFKTYFDTLYNLYVHPNHSGDVTSVGDGATTIANNVVTNAKLAQHPAMTVLANNVAITANIIDLSATGGTDAVLRESGSNIGWGTIATGALGGNIVTNAKLATMAANTVKSNITGSTANASDNDIATVLAQYIHAATSKTTPVSADELALIDSAASNVLKKLTYANLLATLTTAFNALYGRLASANAWSADNKFDSTLTLSPGGTQDYVFSDDSADALTLQSQGSGKSLDMRIFPFDADGTDNAILTLWGVGKTGSVTNRERLIFGYLAADLAFEFKSDASGTGTLRPIIIFTGSNTNQLYIDTGGGVSIGQSANAAKLDILQGTLGSAVMRLASTATNDDPTEDYLQGRTATTNATTTTTLTIAISASNTYWISAEVIARRTGGTSGTADWCGYGKITRVYKTVTGTVTVSQTIDNTFTADWGGSFDFTISGSNLLIQVTGAANNNITWHAFVKVRKVST